MHRLDSGPALFRKVGVSVKKKEPPCAKKHCWQQAFSAPRRPLYDGLHDTTACSVPGARRQAGRGHLRPGAGELRRRGRLLTAAERVYELVQRFARCLVDKRAPEKIRHTLADLVGQRVFGIACGHPGGSQRARAAGGPGRRSRRQRVPCLSPRLGGGPVDPADPEVVAPLRFTALGPPSSRGSAIRPQRSVAVDYLGQRAGAQDRPSPLVDLDHQRALHLGAAPASPGTAASGCLSTRSASSASSSSRVRCSWANRADCQPGGKPCDVGPRSESPSVRSARLERVASYRILCPPAVSRAQGRLPGTGPSGPPRRLQTISAYHGPVMVAGS